MSSKSIQTGGIFYQRPPATSCHLLPPRPFYREQDLPVNLLLFSSQSEGFVCTLLSGLLTRGQSALRSSAALYCFTWREVLHQTAGALQTPPPGPRGGHYDRDERLQSTARMIAEWQQGPGDTLWGENINWTVLRWNGSALGSGKKLLTLADLLCVSAKLQSNNYGPIGRVTVETVSMQMNLIHSRI